MKLIILVMISLGSVIAGCSESIGSREVPVNTTRQTTPSITPGAATQAPRAIATH